MEKGSMSANTAIEWCDHTFNPWIGCTRVGPGCDHCYAEADFDKRRHVVTCGAGQERHATSATTWAQPYRWNRNAEAFQAQHGRRQRVFCASLADVFDNEVPEHWRRDLFTMIAATPNLDWLLLTKRIGNVVPMLTELRHGSDEDLPLLDLMPLPNVWIGATVVNQAEADRDIPKLLATPAAVRFVSIEPMLGPVDVERYLEPLDVYCPDTCDGGRMVKRSEIETWQDRGEEHPFCPSCGLSQATWESAGHGIDWVIAGGESGPKARASHPGWFRSMRDQCVAAQVPFFFKQWGEWRPAEPKDDAAPFPNGWRALRGHPHVARAEELYPEAGAAFVAKFGKKAAGATLDGREWREVPGD